MELSQHEKPDTRRAIEAVLFAVGKRISLSEVVRIVGAPERDVLAHLSALVEEYRARESPLIIVSEGDSWKMTVRERYMPVVKAIIPELELPRGILETLAVIAWKSPVLQSEVIKIRTNKAYEHIDQLEQLGFVGKERKGRSFLLSVTQKFLDYFDLRSAPEMQKTFEGYGDIAKLVELFNRKAQQAIPAQSAEPPAAESEQASIPSVSEASVREPAPGKPEERDEEEEEGEEEGEA